MNPSSLSTDKLAIEGGNPVRRTPFAGWQVFDDNAVEAAAAVLRSGKVNYWSGRQGRWFEQELAEKVGCRYAVAVANGTVALDTALAAVGVGPGDEVVVTCRSFIASASCCLNRGAVPVFADVDADSQNITAETIRTVLSPRTRAIIAVHLAGWPCEMDAIMELAAEHGLMVIEDCAQALGATYRGRPAGSLGHVAAFSFCQDKILSTGGEGGMVTTNDERIWERAWSAKDHGKSWAAVHRPNPDRVFQWLHESLGTNGRMTEMQAAIGRSLLPNLAQWVSTRRRYAALLDERFGLRPELRCTPPPEHVGHSYYKYYVFLRPERLRPGWSRDRIARSLHAEGIPCGSGSCPEIYREKVFDDLGLRPKTRLPAARQLGQTSLMLMVHPTLTEEDILDTCRAMEKVLRVAAVEDEPRAKAA